MSLEESAIVVARFLRANNYTQTLDAFLDEAGLPPDAGSLVSGALTIEQILKEKRLYDLTINFEKVNLVSDADRWTMPAPQNHTTLPLSNPSNILQTIVANLVVASRAEPRSCILVSAANRRLTMIPIDDPTGEQNLLPPQDSPVLSLIVLEHRYLITTAMSGRLSILDTLNSEPVSQRTDHAKYAIKAIVKILASGERLLATAGWDGKVFVYSLGKGSGQAPQLTAPRFSIQLASNPEDILWVEDTRSQRLFLIVARRDSTFLWYYSVDVDTMTDSAVVVTTTELPVAGRQNLAPHSNAWVAFTPAALAVCPSDPGLIAVATSAVPHMKLIIARMLFPNPAAESNNLHAYTTTGSAADGSGANPMSHMSEARAAIALQEREAAAIITHCSTLAPQTNYSTPALAWRPDGSGVWVNSDDGVVRGIESKTGKIISVLSAHEPGSKIRCLWAGKISDPGAGSHGNEILLSGGFDQRLNLWQLQGGST